jgi:FkbH-like protein
MRYAKPMPSVDAGPIAAAAGGVPLKCVVWDLDETLWRGTLLEGAADELAPGVEAAIRALDARGILQSIASKNDHDVAWAQLEALGIAEYFLFPQIGWWSKAKSLETIAERLGIGLDAIAFVDDQAAERDEIAYFLPQVFLVDPARLPALLEEPRLIPRFVTPESRRRRSMYRADIERSGAEDRYEGKRDAFLATLEMRMTIRRATAADLERAEELTVRTNQLNTTGRPFSHEELAALIDSPGHLVLVAQLDDRYGSSGTIGLALVDLAPDHWTIRLLIMSCRVVSRGVGTVLLVHLLQRARRSGVRLRAAYVPTPRNRQMLVTFRFAGFRQIEEDEDGLLLEHDLTRVPPLPGYVEIVSDEPADEAA